LLRHSVTVLLAGASMLVGAIVLDLAGAYFQSLPLLIVSFAFGIAGALVAVRGLMEFLGERF
jgi:hypothetical protein